MKRLIAILAAIVLPVASHAVAYGSLNNFDVVNDTGQKCYGFEIELDGLHSTDVTYTYDYNHYGVPVITEDKTDPLNPKVFVRYGGKKNPDGSYAGFTNPQDPLHPLAPTAGHAFTNPGINIGGEHFGVGFLRSPSVAKYNWMFDDPAAPGTLILGPSVNVATPSFVYVPPVPAVIAAPGIPAVPAVPARAEVVVVPPPPEVPEINAIPQFGVPVWVKILKTVQPSGKKAILNDLLPDDPLNPAQPNWAGDEAPQTEVEWQVFQRRPPGNPAGAGEIPAKDDLPNADETVTRRYEFYVYLGPVNNAPPDGDGEAMQSDYTPDAVGNFISAQMAGFNVVNPLGLVDHLQDGESFIPYVDRTVATGGNSPYTIQITSGALPAGLKLDSTTGVLSGTPTGAGKFTFTVQVTDYDAVKVSRSYDLVIAPTISIARSGFKYSRLTGRFVQPVTFKNLSAEAFTGPVSLALDGLSANASLFNKAGLTVNKTPAGSPYINIDVGSDGILSPGETAVVVLEFTNPTQKGITYAPRLILGPGAR